MFVSCSSLFRLLLLFFFFKQKTSYEMRISDWSSDVCSSDLLVLRPGDHGIDRQPRTRRVRADRDRAVADADPFDLHPGDQHVGQSGAQHRPGADRRRLGVAAIVAVLGSPDRSEEHTSELQSLMRISYAVFCLTKKKHKHIT